MVETIESTIQDKTISQEILICNSIFESTIYRIYESSISYYDSIYSGHGWIDEYVSPSSFGIFSSYYDEYFITATIF